VADLNILLAKTAKSKRQTKKKKIDLTVTNTKFDILPRKNPEKMK